MNNGILPPILRQILNTCRENIHLQGYQQEELENERILSSLVSQSADQVGIALTSVELDELTALLRKDTQSFGILQPLIEDISVSDIIVSGFTKVAIQQGRRNILTDYHFGTQEQYERFVERLLLKSGAIYSTRRPMVDGMIGDTYRIHAVHKTIAEGGPYLTIRINRFSSVTTENLITAGLAPEPVFDYFRQVINSGNTLLVIGEVSTGKTTLARALAAEMPEHDSIVVIEDTPEIRIQHPQVRYLTTREDNIEGEGQLIPSECIRAAMRMAMNRIILGEIRDARAAEAFVDVCASGHPGLSTIHGKDIREGLTRLQLFLGRAQPGVDAATLLRQIMMAVQVVVYVDVCPVSHRRRIFAVAEIGSSNEGILQLNEIFRYSYQNKAEWEVRTRVSRHASRSSAVSSIALHNFPAHLTFSDVLHGANGNAIK